MRRTGRKYITYNLTEVDGNLKKKKIFRPFEVVLFANHCARKRNCVTSGNRACRKLYLYNTKLYKNSLFNILDYLTKDVVHPRSSCCYSEL